MLCSNKMKLIKRQATLRLTRLLPVGLATLWRWRRHCVCAVISFGLLVGCTTLYAGDATDPNRVVVAKDGTGDFTSIQAAIDATKAFPSTRMTIFIKNGEYTEKISVAEMNTHLSLIGESVEKTIITYADHFTKINRGRNSTFYTATLAVEADDFVGKNFTVSNAAGDVGQAIALSVNANRALFHNVMLKGNQDTLYVTGAGKKVFFNRCYIEGTTDFIFGGASVVFHQCQVHALKNSYITAASTPKAANFGFVFSECLFTAAPGVSEVYLGRPWRDHAQTVVVRSELGPHILPQGWHNWGKSAAEKTVFYAEYGNTGAGAKRAGRVQWAHELPASKAKRYTTPMLLADPLHPNWYER